MPCCCWCSLCVCAHALLPIDRRDVEVFVINVRILDELIYFSEPQ